MLVFLTSVIRLKPFLTSVIHLKPFLTSVIRLKPFLTRVIQLQQVDNNPVKSVFDQRHLAEFLNRVGGVYILLRSARFSPHQCTR